MHLLCKDQDYEHVETRVTKREGLADIFGLRKPKNKPLLTHNSVSTSVKVLHSAIWLNIDTKYNCHCLRLNFYHNSFQCSICVQLPRFQASGFVFSKSASKNGSSSSTQDPYQAPEIVSSFTINHTLATHRKAVFTHQKAVPIHQFWNRKCKFWMKVLTGKKQILLSLHPDGWQAALSITKYGPTYLYETIGCQHNLQAFRLANCPQTSGIPLRVAFTKQRKLWSPSSFLLYTAFLYC